MKFEDLPEYIQKYSSRMVHGFRIEFPNFLASEKDLNEEIPKAEKWLKEHNIEYDNRGYWFIPYEGERKEFLEFSDLPKLHIEEIELNPRDFRTRKLKGSKRVTQFARKR